MEQTLEPPSAEQRRDAALTIRNATLCLAAGGIGVRFANLTVADQHELIVLTDELRRHAAADRDRWRALVEQAAGKEVF